MGPTPRGSGLANAVIPGLGGLLCAAAVLACLGLGARVLTPPLLTLASSAGTLDQCSSCSAGDLCSHSGFKRQLHLFSGSAQFR